MAVGSNNLSATLLTTINLCTCHQITAHNPVITIRENYHRGNKVIDLFIYPAGLITQNTTCGIAYCSWSNSCKLKPSQPVSRQVPG